MRSIFKMVVASMLLTLLVSVPMASACIAFLVQDDQGVIFGNSEDFDNPATLVWFVPRGEDAYGRVYFGFDDLYPQGGMNEAGLAFDGFSTVPIPVIKRLDGIVLDMVSLIDKAMANCATVQEALNMFSDYSMKELKNFMLMFADRSGDGAVIEGDEVVRKSGSFQIVTNFHLSKDPKGNKPPSPENYWGRPQKRFRIALDLIEDVKPFTVERARGVLSAIHIEKTIYSNIYDLKNRTIYLYHYHDFHNVVVIDLPTELGKGARFLEMASLFPRNPVYESYLQGKTEEQQRRNAGRAITKLREEDLNRYVGEYQSASALGNLTILLKRNELFGEIQGMGRFRLLPSSRTQFHHTRLVYDIEATFRVDDSHHVEGVSIKTGEQNVFFRRIP